MSIRPFASLIGKKSGELFMKIGLIIPNFKNEKRVALLPSDICIIQNNNLVIEKGFGKNLGIGDDEYAACGCTIMQREEIFKNADIVFSLKLIQPSDYKFLQPGQIIMGWIHPFGSGHDFYNNIAKPNNLTIIDTDSTNPRIFCGDFCEKIEEIDVNFCAENSVISGKSSVLHALLSFGTINPNNKRVAVLSSGNTAQGAFIELSKLGFEPKIFYRKTLHEFLNSIGEYDIIVNGIEINDGNYHIIDKELTKKIKKGTLIIDAAADAGGAIELSKYTTIDNPIYSIDGIYYYCVNNAPSILYKDASKIISEKFSKHIFNLDFEFILNKYLGKKV